MIYSQRLCWGGSVSVPILRLWSLPTTKILPSKPNTASYKSGVWQEAWCFLLFPIKLFEWKLIIIQETALKWLVFAAYSFFLFLLRIWGFKPLMGNHKWKQTCSKFLLTETRAVLEDVINSQRLPFAAPGPEFFLPGCLNPACCAHPRLRDAAAALSFAGTGAQQAQLHRWPQTRCCLHLCLLDVGLTEDPGTDQLVQLDACK